MTSLHEQENLFQPVGIEGTFRRVALVFKENWGAFLAINSVAIILNYLITTIVGFVIISSMLGKSGGGRRHLDEWEDYEVNDDYNEYENAGGDDWEDYNYNSGGNSGGGGGGGGGGSDRSGSYSFNDYGFDYGNSTVAALLWMNPVVVVGVVLNFFSYYMITCLSDGASIRAVAETYVGRAPVILDCAKQAVAKLPALMIAVLFVGLALVVPFLVVFSAGWFVFGRHYQALIYAAIFLGIIFAVYVAYVTIVTYHMFPLIMIENQAVVPSIKGSKSLQEGHFTQTFAVLFLWWLAKIVVNAIVTTVTSNDSGALSAFGGLNVDTSMGSAGDGILAILFAILFSTLGSIFQAVIYFDLRVKKENYTREMLLNDVGQEVNSSYAKMEDQGSDDGKADTPSDEEAETGKGDDTETPSAVNPAFNGEMA